MQSSDRAYRGSFVQTSSLGNLDILEDYLLVVDQDGFISHFGSATSPSSVSILGSLSPIIIPRGSFLIPVFCDLHLHAPQYMYQGTGLDLPLLQWLERYALKAEEQLDSNPALAKRVYETLAKRLLELGTGVVMLFGTIREETKYGLILAQAMQDAGVRAFVGKSSMDISPRLTYKEPSAKAAVDAARSFVDKCHGLVDSLQPHERVIEPVLTPRYVPTCSDDLLQGLSGLMAEKNMRLQSHLAEGYDQATLVRTMRGIEDIDVFAKYNLLTDRTLQAHCTFLAPPDLDRISQYGTAVAHCPLSNAYLSEKQFRLREALNRNVKVGLGTDIAGGYHADIMSAMRMAVAITKMRAGEMRMKNVEEHGEDSSHDKKEGDLVVDWKEALYLATKGGASAIGLKSGVFEVGAPFDAQMINLFDAKTGSGVGPIDFFFDNTPERLTEIMVEKWWCLGDSRNRKSMWIQGKQVFSA